MNFELCHSLVMHIDFTESHVFMIMVCNFDGKETKKENMEKIHQEIKSSIIFKLRINLLHNVLNYKFNFF